jgi:hypothetical protein
MRPILLAGHVRLPRTGLEETARALLDLWLFDESLTSLFHLGTVPQPDQIQPRRRSSILGSQR